MGANDPPVADGVSLRPMVEADLAVAHALSLRAALAASPQ